MENKDIQQLTKQEKFIQEIQQLEIQIAEVKGKMHTLEKEEKMEVYKNNILEVKKDSLKSSIEFYEKYLNKMNNKLGEKQTMFVTLSMADEYYDKLLELYREKHLRRESSFSVEDIPLFEAHSTFQNQIDTLAKQAEQLRTTVEINSSTIENLKKTLPL